MQKEEFVQHVKALGGNLEYDDLSEETYRIIEHVYNYHPAIGNKDDIARIWLLPGGFTIIKDMVKTADEWMKRDEEIGKVRTQMAKLQKKLDNYARELRIASGR